MLFGDPSGGEALAIVWLKVVTFGVRSSGLLGFACDRLPSLAGSHEIEISPVEGLANDLGHRLRWK